MCTDVDADVHLNDFSSQDYSADESSGKDCFCIQASKRKRINCVEKKDIHTTTVVCGIAGENGIDLHKNSNDDSKKLSSKREPQASLKISRKVHRVRIRQRMNSNLSREYQSLIPSKHNPGEWDELCHSNSKKENSPNSDISAKFSMVVHENNLDPYLLRSSVILSTNTPPVNQVECEISQKQNAAEISSEISTMNWLRSAFDSLRGIGSTGSVKEANRETTSTALLSTSVGTHKDGGRGVVVSSNSDIITMLSNREGAETASALSRNESASVSSFSYFSDDERDYLSSIVAEGSGGYDDHNDDHEIQLQLLCDMRRALEHTMAIKATILPSSSALIGIVPLDNYFGIGDEKYPLNNQYHREWGENSESIPVDRSGLSVAGISCRRSIHSSHNRRRWRGQLKVRRRRFWTGNSLSSLS
jgi:hypothetical protein